MPHGLTLAAIRRTAMGAQAQLSFGARQATGCAGLPRSSLGPASIDPGVDLSVGSGRLQLSQKLL
jgi:hypothetical protein